MAISLDYRDEQTWDPRYRSYSKEMKEKVDKMTEAAALNGKPATVNQYLIEGLDVNAVNWAGITCLHHACWYGHRELAEMLLKQESIDINALNISQETPLHCACEKYNPSDQDIIDICTSLIQAGADLHGKDEDQRTPLDHLPKKYGIKTSGAKPLRKVIKEREYKQLLAEGSVPVSVVKLLILGDPAAGKTTLKDSLITKHPNLLQKLKLFNKPKDQPHKPTPGIDVNIHEVDGVGMLSIWDAAGQAEYHVTHGLFLGSQNAIVVVVYNIKEGNQAKTKLQDWLRFLRCGQPEWSAKVKVIIVATHLDEFHTEQAEAHRVAQLYLSGVKADFGKALNISEKVLLVNARQPWSKEMQELRDTLKEARDEITHNTMIPKICEDIQQQKANWTSAESPILSYEEYTQKVKELSELVEENVIRSAANFLQDMGEIYLVHQKGHQEGDQDEHKDGHQEGHQDGHQDEHQDKHQKGHQEGHQDGHQEGQQEGQKEGQQEGQKQKEGNQEEQQEEKVVHVVLDMKWLCDQIIGPTFAGKEFEGRLKMLPNKAFYTAQELKDHYSGIAHFPTLKLLLQNLDLMVTSDDCEFIIPAKLPENTSFKSTLTLNKGRCIFCVDNKTTMFAPLLFPAVQARIIKDLMESNRSRPLISLKSLQFAARGVKGLVSQTNTKHAINVAVENMEDNAELCYEELEEVTEIIERAIDDLSPGTAAAVDKGYLSPKSLQNKREDVDVKYYTQQEIDGIEDRGGSVSINIQKSQQEYVQEEEKTTDILIAGGDPHFIEKQGLQCSYHWMLERKKAKLFFLLDDTTSSLRTDYRSLSELLQVDERECPQGEKFHSEAIIKRWVQTTGKTMTLGLLLNLLKHPGLVGNSKAADIIEKMFQENGHQGPFALEDVHKIIEGLPDTAVLLWRAVLRKCHDQLLRNITPSKLTRLSSFLSAKDEEDIKVTEKNSPVGAVDLLISKLIQMREPADWPDKFLESLEAHHTQVSRVLREVQETLKKDILAPVSPQIEQAQRNQTKVGGNQTIVGGNQTNVSGNQTNVGGNQNTVSGTQINVSGNLYMGKTAGMQVPEKCTCRAKEELEKKWNKKDASLPATEFDLPDVTKLLGPDDFKRLYLALGIASVDAEKAEKEADTKSEDLKAKTVLLKHWIQRKGSEATYKELLDTLGKMCTCKN